jgi:alpha-ribazole phosphatase
LSLVDYSCIEHTFWGRCPSIEGEAIATKEIFLLRHGDTGRQGCYLGSTDVSLVPAGRQQLRETANSLQLHNFCKVICSPMLRCRQSCEILGLQTPYQVNNLLKEVDFGRWEGKTFDQIAAEDAELVTAWINDPVHFCFPDGECLDKFYARVSLIFSMLKNDDGKRILLVTHGGIIRHLLCLCLGIPSEKYLAFDVQPGSYASLHLYSGGAVLTGLNLRG